MNTDASFTGPVNIGNPVEFTILELAKLVIKLTNSKSELVFEPLPSDDPTQRRPDISIASKELEWKPNTELEAGLSHTIDFFRSQLEL